jgi:arylsulfatase A-like enzyme
MSYHALHRPENAMKSSLARFQAKPAGQLHHDPGRAAITLDLDTGVGRLLDAITALNLGKNTYVIYMADNGGGGGGAKRGKDKATTLRGGKGGLWDGGIRVPFIVRGPGIAPNSWCHQPVTGYDWFPTFCRWAGVKESLPGNLDGGDLTPLLRGANQPVHRRDSALLFHFPHYQGETPQSAIRDGDFKLLLYHEDNTRRLFDLSKDPGETTDLSSTREELADLLEANLRARLRQAAAEMPEPNPSFDPGKARRGAKAGKAGKRNNGTPES